MKKKDNNNNILDTEEFKNFNIKFNYLLMQYPLFLNIITLVLGIFTWEMKYFSLNGLLQISDLLNYGFKYISKKWLPNEITNRPSNNGIIYNNVKLGTGVMPFIGNVNVKDEESKGFPSGHSQTVGVFTTIMVLYIYNRTEDNKDEWYKNYKYYILVFIGVLVLWQRWYSNCHTPLQIFTGTIIGIGLGIGSWEFYDNYM